MKQPGKDHPSRFAVMGNPITHSLSPDLHQTFAQIAGFSIYYEKIQVNANFQRSVHEFFALGGKGLNITAPYKIDAFHLCDRLTPRASVAQSVNTMWMEEGILWGDNTDGIGLVRALCNVQVWQGNAKFGPSLDVCKLHTKIEPSSCLPAGRSGNILIIGAGGAVRGIIPALLAIGCPIYVYNRTAVRLDELIKQFSTIRAYDPILPYDLVIYAVPTPIEFQTQWVKNKPFCMDLSYDLKQKTPFVAWANAQNCNAIDGYTMLVEQALEAFNGWHHTQLTWRDVEKSISLFNDPGG